MHYPKIKLSQIFTYSGIVLLFIFLLAGCNNNSPVQAPTSMNNGTHNAALSVNTKPVVTNSFSVTTAKFLVKRVEFDGERNEENELAEGPFVVHIVPGSTSTNITFGKLPAGTFHEINFLIHKPSPVEVLPDPDFRTGTSDNQRFSFIITGDINGVTFIYRSRVTIDEEIEIEHPVTVAPSGFINVTLQVDPNTWFFTNNGVFLDPTNPDNAHTIDMNIKASFRRAFEDDNEDGQPDGGG